MRALNARRAGVPLLAAVLLLTAALPPAAHATFPVVLSPRTLPPGATEAFVAGAHGNVDPDYWAPLAGVRHGFLRSVEVGVRGGAAFVETVDGRDATPLFGAEVKVQVLRESIDIPVDFAVGTAWTAARPDGNTWSELAFTALFGKQIRADWLEDVLGGPLGAVVGAQLAFLGGSARPGREDSAAYGVVAIEVALPAGFTVVPEAKFGTATVLGLSVRYRF